MITMDDPLQAAVDRANARIRALLRPHPSLAALPPDVRARYDELVDAYLDAVRRRDETRAGRAAREADEEPEPAAA
jgi:hypothetical protein